MRGRFLASTSSTIVLGLALALTTATLAAAAPPSNLNVTAMPGNEAENAIAVNPTNPSNVVAMSTLPDVVSGLAVGVSFNAGSTWTRHVIGGTTGDPLGAICCDQQLALAVRSDPGPGGDRRAAGGAPARRAGKPPRRRNRSPQAWSACECEPAPEARPAVRPRRD